MTKTMKRMHRLTLRIFRADGGRTKPVIEFVPSGSLTTNENDYFWFGEKDGGTFGNIDADDLFAFVKRARAMQKKVRGE